MSICWFTNTSPFAMPGRSRVGRFAASSPSATMSPRASRFLLNRFSRRRAARRLTACGGAPTVFPPSAGRSNSRRGRALGITNNRPYSRDYLLISGDKMNERPVASPIRRTVTARPLALAIEGGVAIATLQRPPVNAVNEEWLTCLEQALDSVERAEEVRVLWIRSSEPNFCAGADLDFLRAHFATAEGRKNVIDFTRRLQAAYARLESMDVVTLAEIGG